MEYTTFEYKYLKRILLGLSLRKDLILSFFRFIEN